MIYHFVSNSPYTRKFIYFMIENKNHFDIDEHIFIINDSGTFKWDEKSLQQIKHIRVNTKWGFVTVLNNLLSNDKLLIHGLFNTRLLVYLYLNRKLTKRCIWSIWGGDVYYYKNKGKNFKHNLIEYLRKVVIPEIPIITSLIKGDYEIAKQVYGSNAKYIYSFYPIPADFTLIDDNYSIKGNHEDIKTILVGNSGDPSNNHNEVFKMLNRFKQENIKIICPLSYGNSQYITKIINQGKALFGSKFIPLTEYIPPNEYIKILLKVDVAVMNHNRQQGLGNIITLLALKKKVFIRSDTTPFQFFLKSGVHIFDTCNISSISLVDFMELGNTFAEQNRMIVTDIFSNNSACKNWSEIFHEI